MGLALKLGPSTLMDTKTQEPGRLHRLFAFAERFSLNVDEVPCVWKSPQHHRCLHLTWSQIAIRNSQQPCFIRDRGFYRNFRRLIAAAILREKTKLHYKIVLFHGDLAIVGGLSSMALDTYVGVLAAPAAIHEHF